MTGYTQATVVMNTNQLHDEYFGDKAQSKLSSDVIRVWFRNVNGIVKSNDRKSLLEWKEFSTEAAQQSLSIVGMAETNYYWSRNRAHNLLQHLNRWCKRAVLRYSSSVEPALGRSTYQPGGTATILTGDIVTRQVATEKHSDPSGLGRWSAITIRRSNDAKLTILTFYRVCRHSVRRAGSLTAYKQQYRLLRLSGISNPDPRSLALRDFTQKLRELLDLHHELIVMMDANEDMERNSNLHEFILQTGLVDVIRNRHGSNVPATTSRGSHQIDYIMATPGLIPYLRHSGLVTQAAPPYATSDHCALYADFDASGLLGDLLAPLSTQRNRLLVSNKPLLAARYVSVLGTLYEKHGILQWRDRLMARKAEWNFNDREELSALDTLQTELCLIAEQRSRFPSDTPWSPPLHLAWLLTVYWKLRRSQQRNKQRKPHSMTDMETEIRQKCGDTKYASPGHPIPLSILDFDSKKIGSNMKAAITYLCILRSHGEQLRSRYTSTELELAALAQDDETQRETILSRIHHSEARRRTYNLLKLYTKEQHSCGVTEISIPADPTQNPKDPKTVEWTTLRNRDEMETALRQRNEIHFAQAAQTPFLQSPLQPLVGHSGLCDYGQEILDGSANLPDGITTETKMLLNHLRYKSAPMIDERPTLNDMQECFRRWPEKTSTSPSGKHLGHYRALAQPRSSHVDIAEYPECISRDTLQQVNLDILNLCVDTITPLARWKTVHNLFLRKDVNNNRVHRHRVIHLTEADWTFLTKFYSANRFAKYCEQMNTFSPLTFGGRKGRQAVDMAWLKVLVTDQIWLEQKTAWIFDNDAASCYDRIPEAVANLSLASRGHPQPFLRLHSALFQQLKYHIVTSYGVSDKYNTYSDEHPFIGPGQGAGDAPIRWGCISSDILDLYAAEATPFIFQPPQTTDESIRVPAAAFVDDTIAPGNLMECPEPISNVYETISTNAQLWESLLHATGGKLELSKCSCYVYDFLPDLNGKMQPTEIDNNNQIKVTDSETGREINIRTIPTTDSYKTMGVHISGDQRWDTQYSKLLSASKQYASGFGRSPIYGQSAFLSYMSSYLPKMTYSLSVTGLSPTQCEKIQSPALMTFLPKIGLNRHFPREVVTAPLHFGGLDMRHLYYEQGLRHILLLIRQLRDSSYLPGRSFRRHLATAQLWSGFSSPILEVVDPTIHFTGWISHLRDFLRFINGKIVITQAWTPNPCRSPDIALMSAAQQCTTREGAHINRCRLHLQVTYLSELLDSELRLIPGALGELDDAGEPLLWSHTRSLLRWPAQPRPPEQSWKIWRRFIQCTRSTHSSGIGQWAPSYGIERIWTAYLTTDNTLIVRDDDGDLTSRQPIEVLRTKLVYEMVADGYIQEIPAAATPTVLRNGGTTVYRPNNRLDRNTLHNQANQATHQSVDTDETPRVNHFLATLATWEKQMFRSLTVSLHWTNRWAIAQNVNIYCGAYHRSHGLGTVNILLGEHMLAEFQCVSPTAIGQSSPSRARLSALVASLRLLSWIHTQISEVTARNHLGNPPIIYRIHLDDENLINRCEQGDPNPLTNNYDLLSAVGFLSKLIVPSGLIHYKYTNPRVENPTDDQQRLAACLKSSRALHSEMLVPVPIPPTAPWNSIGLTIDGVTVVNRLENAVRNAASTPSLRQYYIRTKGWHKKAPDLVDWYPHGRALHNLPFHTRLRILKFIHGWLPVNARQHREDPTIPRTCLCCQEVETVWHVLYCAHPSRREAKDNFMKSLDKYFRTSHTDPAVAKVLTCAFQSLPATPTFENTPEHVNEFIRDQQLIGWHELYCGRLSKSLLDVQNNYRDRHQKGHPVERWAYRLIRLVWSYVNDVWMLRNEQQHATINSSATTTDRLRNQIIAVYSMATNLPEDDKALFSQPIEEILAMPHVHQEHWIAIHLPFVRKQQKAAQDRAVQDVRPISEYFRQTADGHSPRPSKSRRSDLRPP